MKIYLLYQSKDSKNHYADAERLFIGRIAKYIKFEAIQLAPLKISKSLNSEQVQQKEMEYFQSRIPVGSRVYLLDEKGKRYASRDFAKWLDNQMAYDSRDICFVIGGAYGFSKTFKQLAEGQLSLSDMTMAHHLARVVFLEQLYRGFTIINNEPYHND
ncbi:MAG: 23S rRNA (pseudouridine(1915)-N(3))-methyltransferase RlmH [Saprospiraceae bacterium]|nr:23S rRNA (pseudouridine(1915)-N(3))-methyltransferase RlmH [Saprospiraceae bacterium]